MIRLVALDMAGTTIDDHGAVYRALQSAVEETGATVQPRDLQRWMGTDKVQAIAALMEDGGAAPDVDTVTRAFQRFREILAGLYAENPPVELPGVAAALAELRDRGVRIALTTGFDDEVAAPLLASLGWTVGTGPDDLLDAVVTTSAVAAGRPAPYLIHHAMEATGITDVREVLAAGDTVVDVQAARNAGVVAVGVLSGALDAEDFAGHPLDHLLTSVAELPGLLDLS
ncbi:phosphonatase-like hydrolase [Galbitalea soli]|uniref:Phosphonatase-like hydrolase n=1 Tax=Galbitalea soli TaxID=1268042 RepID=A0A7C9PMC3_9MICO|nr:phosphonatase-like hydrolase [Galbitalea soli]NEM90671.1 phosphonatase-like hydrolase [Galbitalea soli]NYJ31389.1 phosphonatase-like hydrolase [Galbitalea soli]